jgi:hypothetical protein
MMVGLLLGLYVPGIVLLAWRVWTVAGLDPVEHRVLAIAILGLSLDLLAMAIFDLQQVQRVRAQGVTDSRLDVFWRVTIGTIALELIGIYGAQGSLWLGAMGILISQIGFNLFAGVQLLPEENVKIVPFGIRDRAVVLGADGLGFGLVSLGFAGVRPLGMAIGLLGMVVIYGGVKILGLVKSNETRVN